MYKRLRTPVFPPLLVLLQQGYPGSFLGLPGQLRLPVLLDLQSIPHDHQPLCSGL